MMMKKRIRKNILTGVVGILFCGASNSFAVESKVKIGGVIDVKGIYYNTNGNSSQKKFSVYNENYGLYSSGHFLLDYQLISEEGWKYGTKISVQQTTRNDRGAPFAIYVESGYGRIEAGSEKTAGGKMMLTGYSIACAGGNGWDAFIVPSPKKGENYLVPYITNFSSFLDAKTRASMKSDYSRKISYYTPKFGFDEHKFQLGISYAPDSSNSGHTEINDPQLYALLTGYPYKFAIKDGISYGITYSGKFTDELSAKIALTGEKGKALAFNKADNSRANIKFKSLNTYNIGAEVSYNKFSVAASYMDYNKSLSNATIDRLDRETDIYAYGIRYKFMKDKAAVSLNHFFSNYKKNKLDAVSLGFDYIITKGIKAYTQFTHFYTKGKYIDDGGLVKNDTSKGNIVIVGGKISL